MGEIERVELDQLRLGKQGIQWEVLPSCPCTRLGEGLVGTVCSDVEWRWCSCLLCNLETHSVHKNWIRHTQEARQTPMIQHHWFILIKRADLEPLQHPGQFPAQNRCDSCLGEISKSESLMPLSFSSGGSARGRQLGSWCWHVAEHFLLVLFGMQSVAYLLQKFLVATYIVVGSSLGTRM